MGERGEKGERRKGVYFGLRNWDTGTSQSSGRYIKVKVKYRIHVLVLGSTRSIYLRCLREVRLMRAGKSGAEGD